MVKGSQSQASSTVSKGGSGSAGAGRIGPAGVGPRGTAGASSLRRRKTSSSASGSGGGGGFGGSGNNMLRFYTDDAPGLKISPTVVLVMSLCFIGFVTALHVIGKLYHYKSGGA
jgi:protein transport protein SEC61 subunit beta